MGITTKIEAYREFYDVPRIFVVWFEGMQLLFDCQFDEAVSEYSDVYNVFLLPGIPADALPKSWEHVSDLAIKRLGSVEVKQVSFDSTRRREIDVSVIERLIGQNRSHLNL